MVVEYAQLIGKVHASLALQAGSTSDEQLEQLRSLNLKVRCQIKDFLKALRYSFNFVEQYYEHDFCAKLTQEEQFLEELTALNANLKI